MINKKEIVDVFKKYEVEGYLNYGESHSKELSYETFMDEVSINDLKKSGTSVVIIKDNRKASASFDGFSIEDLEKAISEIKEYALVSEFDKDIELVNVSDEAEADFRSEEIMDIDFAFLKGEFEKVKNYKFEDHINFEEFSYGYKEWTSVFVNSLWAYKVEKSNGISAYMGISWELNGRKEEEYLYKSNNKKFEFSNGKIAKTEKELTDKLNAVSAPFETGEYVVTLKNDAAVWFLGMLLGHFSAEWIREGFSMFTNNKIWDKLFSDKLTVVTDPTLKGWNSSALIDWEGVTLEKRTIIENGIWKEKFADYKNVKKDSTLRLWNSTATNIIIEWDKTKDFLKESSFLFTNLMAYHTVDSNTGKFALNGEGYVVRDGKKAEYIKNISLAWNIKDIFTNIVAIWDDDNENGWNACPSITFKGGTIIV